MKTYGNTLNPERDCWVGIDQSYTGFGLTILDVDGGWTTWVYKSSGSGVERLDDIQEFLKHVFWSLYPDLKIIDAAMEGYAFGSQMANMLGELGGLVKMFFYKELDIKPLIVPPTSLKKYVAGKGTGVQKNQMLLHIYKKWGVEFRDDNAADSFALAKIVSGLHSLAYEKEVYEKLNDGKHRA